MPVPLARRSVKIYINGFLNILDWLVGLDPEFLLNAVFVKNREGFEILLYLQDKMLAYQNFMDFFKTQDSWVGGQSSSLHIVKQVA